MYNKALSDTQIGAMYAAKQGPVNLQFARRLIIIREKTFTQVDRRHSRRLEKRSFGPHVIELLKKECV